MKAARVQLARLKLAGMHRLACFVLVSALAAPLLCSAEARGGLTIHRCIGEHGEIVFSDARCGSGAELRIDRPTARERSSDPAAAVAMACPRSPDELRAVFADALSRRDTNAISSLVHWHGVGGAEARERLREIDELARRPLIGIELGTDAMFATDEAASPGILTVRTGSTKYAGPREREFRVGETGGCYWIDW